MTHATTFDAALAAIHGIVGCVDVARKPILAYKLSNAAKNAPSMSLQSTSDWDGCLEGVHRAEKATKGDSVAEPMSSSFGECLHYCFSLLPKVEFDSSA
jgi:hypothetical protein